MGKKLITKKVRKVRASFAKEGYVIPEDWEYVNNYTKIPFTCNKGHEHSMRWKCWNKGIRCSYCSHTAPISSEDVRASFAKEGYTLSEDWEYVNNKVKIPFTCNKGHEHSMSWGCWNIKGQRCMYCSYNVPSSEEVRASFTSEGYTLPEDWEYVNQKTNIPSVCDKGHKHSIKWDSWNSGCHCKYCNRDIKTKELRKSFASEGYVLPEDWEYVHSLTKIPYVCNKGHENSTTLNIWNSGRRCKYCSFNMPSTEDIRASFTKEGYVLPEDWIYVNTITLIPYECSRGHKHEISWVNWKEGHRCKYCSLNIPSPEDVRTKFAKEGYVIPEDWEYVNCKTKIPFTCDNGHNHSMTLTSWNSGSRCYFCMSKDKIYESATIDILNEYGIIYDYQYKIKVNNKNRYYVDFYLYDYDFFLEIDENHHKYQVDNDRIREGVITGLTGIKFERLEAVRLETFKADLIELLCL